MIQTKKALGAVLALATAATVFTSAAYAEDTASSTTSTSATTTSSTADLGLVAKIETNYKVVGSFKPLADQKVKLYKVTVSYSDGKSPFAFTLPATASSFVDWHARQNMVNKYTIYALLEDGSMVTGNSVSVVMDANGLETTEDAIASYKAAMEESKKQEQTKKEEYKKQEEVKKEEIKKNQEQIQQNRQEYALNSGVMKDYLRKLSDGEWIALKAIMNAHQSERDVILKDSTLSVDEKNAKLKELLPSHAAVLLPYVAEEKKDAFRDFIEGRANVAVKNQELREENKEMRSELKEQKKEMKDQKQEQKNQKQQTKAAFLSAKLQSSLNTALDKIPAEKREATYKKVLENVDKAIAKIEASSMAKTKKERTLGQLNDIADIVQARLDALTGTSSDTNILDEVLSGTN